MVSLKNVFIIGDSYSTYESYIPAGYDLCYGDNIENGTDVNRVEQTWRHQLIVATNSDMVANHKNILVLCNAKYDL